MKDECNSKVIREFVGLRAKMYSIKLDTEVKKRAKGVQKSILKKEIAHQDFINSAVSEKTSYRHMMRNFRTENHDIFTIVQNKTSPLS